MVQVFAPGKIILAGEHAVVYGELALAASIGRGVRVKVVEGKRDYLEDRKGLVQKAIDLGGGENLGVEIESELPVGAGLGSSAAVSVAVIKGVREYLRRPIANEELFEMTMVCEKQAHGNASGIDPAAVVYEGLIAYTKGKPIEKLRINKPVKLLLVDGGRPHESTKELVEWVGNRQGKEIVIEEIARVTKRVRTSLMEGKDVDGLIDENGRLLEELGVVSASGKRLSGELRRLGYGVKITGAGGRRAGSGMMIVVGENFARAKETLNNGKISYFETTVGHT